MLGYTCLSAQSSYDPLQYLVVFDESTTQAEIDQIRTEHHAEELWISPYSQVRYWKSDGYPHYVGNDLIGDIKEEVKRLKGRPKVSGVGLDHRVIGFVEMGGPIPTSCYEDFEFKSQASNHSTIVSILDTGLTPLGDYPADYTFSYGNYSGFNYISSGADLGDNNGHGTHLAGVISHVSQHLDFNGPNQSEIVFDIRKVFDESGEGSISNIVLGFDDAVLTGARVVNMSFAYYSEKPTQKLDPLEHSILKARENEVLVICAAGNEYMNNDIVKYPAFPASYTCDNILSVGSVDCNSFLSKFSNYGYEAVDITFLGEYIPGPSPTGDLVLKSGTSQATAVISGIATAASSYMDNPDYEKVKCAIMSTATYEPNLQGYVLSSGIANALAAATLQALEDCDPYNDKPVLSTIDESISFKDWKASPNPFWNQIVVKLDSPGGGNHQIKVLNSLGQSVFERNYTLNIGQNEILIDELSQLTKGTYFLQINNGHINEYKTIVKM